MDTLAGEDLFERRRQWDELTAALLERQAELPGWSVVWTQATDDGYLSSSAVWTIDVQGRPVRAVLPGEIAVFDSHAEAAAAADELEVPALLGPQAVPRWRLHSIQSAGLALYNGPDPTDPSVGD